jgi:hypothetical protein
MAQSKITGYKSIFGFVLPDWVDESIIRSMVTLLLSSVAMLFVLIFVIWPKFADVEALRSTLSRDQESLVSLRNSKTGLDNLSEQIPDSVQDVVLSAIPQTYSPESVVFLLRKIGDTSGVSIVSYKLPSGSLFEATGSAKKNSGDGGLADFVEYPITLKVSAPVSSLLVFIDKIESSLPFGVVSDLGIQEVTKLAKSGSTSIQMDLQVSYYQVVLKTVDINKISPITGEDLDLVKSLATFSKYSTPTISGSVPTIATSSASLFGF